ncbi:uncharacterized protein LOC106662083 [Cimex lectularius]|uniref:Uncharacterized protein n=1 Tax=Cimex lectularius TaxID=79782 RepID=A0A8I6R8S4_CIMLE|nr:uncharacterized protein LOC106662083 [Cimex lectularius]
MVGALCIPKDCASYRKGVECTPKTAKGKDMLLIPCNDNVQTLPHPVVVSLPEIKPIIPNRFAQALYLKYPFLVPKRYPEDNVNTINCARHADHYKTSYSIDYGIKEHIPFLMRSPGMHIPKEKFQLRDPYKPYIHRVYTNEITSGPTFPWSCPPAALNKAEKNHPPSSEYNDNINRMAKLFLKKKVFNKKVCIKMKRQHTLPPFESILG